MSDASPTFSFRLILRAAFVALVLPAIAIPISGDVRWWQAWVFAGLSAIGFIASRALVATKNPDLLAERSRMTDLADVKSWDKVLAPLVAFGLLFVLIVAGVEHRLRGGEGAFPAFAVWTGFGLCAAGYTFGSWALYENRFFSGVVRIQRDRGHKVVSTGPYRFVRHPGYTGGLFVYLATPVVLGSPWAFAPAVLACALLVARTALEDRALRAELEGYEAYAAPTRYRLVPLIW